MGNFFSAFFPPRPPFDIVGNVPDLTGQVIIVTGGNTGIGKETCKVLLNKNAKVYLAARSKTKADEAIEWLKKETGGKVAIFLELDLASLASVRKAAEEFKSLTCRVIPSKEHELHVLFNSAGVMMSPVNEKTLDGYDLQFGTNVLGHYFFTTLLLPTLIHTAKNSPAAGGQVRVINTSSAALWHPPRGGIAWDTLGTDEASHAACRRVGRYWLYGQSKLVSVHSTSFSGSGMVDDVQGNVLFSNELARLYQDQGVVSISLHPGAIKTDLHRHTMPWIPLWIKESLMDILLYSASQGALTQLYAGVIPEARHLTGKALLDKNAKVYLAARSRSRAEDAIEWLKKETGGKTAIFLELDLANLGSIRKSVQEFKSKEQELHVPFNNAGVLMPPLEHRAASGHEMHFATNVLGHYLLTMLLLPTLIHTAKFSTLAGGHARVINASSAPVYRPPQGGIVWETLGRDEASFDACRRVGSFGLYSQSKLGNVLFSNELAKRYADQGIVSVSVHPGFIKTEVSRNMNIPRWLQALVMLLFWEISVFPPSQGALTQLYAGTVSEVESLNGKFLVP
ncbi:hypothetical protein FRC09_005481 [Ceratobasidium sp. 395]|nr:hypothetical protein FRC09_005481 [Ceratobasidium sp. 395]